ncbi:MAG: hypothetical protein MUO26_04910 [Methanotrichaceae archaeon]|nr:hypothetical protein [Methanotrichaceae archaeon]
MGGLQAVIINTEPLWQMEAAMGVLRYTGLEFQGAFLNSNSKICVLKTPNFSEFRSADILITSRNNNNNPFELINMAPKSSHFPNTRLETFIFETKNLEEYISIQKSYGFRFLSDHTIDGENFSFIQIVPSRFTGNSIGFLEWTGNKGDYRASNSVEVAWTLMKPELRHLNNIRWLDHAATRVKAEDRNDSVLEFMRLTSYDFDFAVYVPSLNSITSVVRLSDSDYSMVFTSGITPYIGDKESGPTEKYIHNYGTRVHHIAFQTENIEETIQSLGRDGMKYLLELVGSPEEGLKQTFTEPSKNTLLVIEYIHRYGDFDGFFTKSNVTLLTEATDKQ